MNTPLVPPKQHPMTCHVYMDDTYYCGKPLHGVTENGICVCVSHAAMMVARGIRVYTRRIL